MNTDSFNAEALLRRGVKQGFASDGAECVGEDLGRNGAEGVGDHLAYFGPRIVEELHQGRHSRTDSALHSGDRDKRCKPGLVLPVCDCCHERREPLWAYGCQSASCCDGWDGGRLIGRCIEAARQARDGCCRFATEYLERRLGANVELHLSVPVRQCPGRNERLREVLSQILDAKFPGWWPLEPTQKVWHCVCADVAHGKGRVLFGLWAVGIAESQDPCAQWLAVVAWLLGTGEGDQCRGGEDPENQDSENEPALWHAGRLA